MSKDLALGLFLFIKVVVEIFQRVGHHEVHSIVKLSELLIVLVIGILFGFLPAVFYTVGRYIALFLIDNVLSLFAVGLSHAFLDLF